MSFSDRILAAYNSTPGPQNIRQALSLFLKGLCMGTADIIPGVSGGTIAFITGIYESLIDAIRSINNTFIKALVRFDFIKALQEIHARFLIILLSGIAIAIVSLARLMNMLLQEYPVQTWGFFMGLILASVIVLGKKIRKWMGSGGLFFGIGSLGAYLLMGVIPLQTPETSWFIFLSGMIAICAMILPGISGAFILLILGKYTYITTALKNPFLPVNLMIIIIFCSGCLLGIILFSRLLHYMLKHYHNQTLATLTGFMFGSLRKIWPWKETLDSIAENNKIIVLSYRNVLPQHINGAFILAISIALLGFLMVVMLNKLAEKQKKSDRI